MKVLIDCLTQDRIMRRACDMTRKPGANPSKMPRRKIYQCEHSPCRTIRFWIELIGIPSFVSVHLVRHKIGVEHFVESNRDDRGGAGDTEVNRLTPVNHGMDVNAAALIAMSRKRLCFMSHKATVATWSRVRKAMRVIDPDLADFMVPECVYRGFCPEIKCCGYCQTADYRAAVVRYRGE